MKLKEKGQNLSGKQIIVNIDDFDFISQKFCDQGIPVLISEHAQKGKIILVGNQKIPLGTALHSAKKGDTLKVDISNNLFNVGEVNVSDFAYLILGSINLIDTVNSLETYAGKGCKIHNGKIITTIEEAKKYLTSNNDKIITLSHELADVYGFKKDNSIITKYSYNSMRQAFRQKFKTNKRFLLVINVDNEISGFIIFKDKLDD